MPAPGWRVASLACRAAARRCRPAARPGRGTAGRWRWRAAALLLHLAAAALALGLVAGLYLRGLVLDFRAGWQSTFLDAATVRAVLATLLAPAVALTGIAVPDAAALEALRVGPDRAATAAAAPWIHLYAAMLAAVRGAAAAGPGGVVGARARGGCRAAVAAAGRRPISSACCANTAAARRRVQVLPHGAAPTPQAALGLRALLAQVLGPGCS